MNDLYYALESSLGMITILAAAFIVGALIVEAARALLRAWKRRWLI